MVSQMILHMNVVIYSLLILISSTGITFEETKENCLKRKQFCDSEGIALANAMIPSMNACLCIYFCVYWFSQSGLTSKKSSFDTFDKENIQVDL